MGEEAIVAIEDAEARCMAMEKKARNFDKIVTEWKNKIEGLQSELDQTQVECRSYSTELFKVKTTYDETNGQLDGVRHENKNLSTEIKDIMDQISEGGRTIHEIDKIRKRLEGEKLELQAALEEAEGTLEQEENKVLRSQVTEECFQQGHLNFAGKTSWIYWKPNNEHFYPDGWMPIELKTTRIGTTPEGSEWAKVNLPKRGSTHDSWAFKDLVEVPETLDPGHYVLSFRWDCQQSPQVWNACANIKIV